MRRRFKRAAAMKTWLIVTVVVVATAGGLRFTVFKGSDHPYELATTPVETGPIVMMIETNGTVETLRTVLVGCETTGKIVEIAVDHDEAVQKDQVVCRIDPELVEAQHQQSVADLNRAKSALVEARISKDEQAANLPVLTEQALARKQEAEVALADAEYNWKRIDELYKAGNASETEWKAFEFRWKTAQAKMTAATAAYKQAVNDEEFLPKRADAAIEQADAAEKLAQARFNTTKTQVDKCVIRSPIDGIVLKRYMDLGATVNATFQTPPLFLLAPSLDRMRVNARVSESDIGHIEIGQTARFTIDAKGKKTFEGRITERRSQPDVIQNVVTYTVIFDVDNDKQQSLLPGLTVNVEIECVNKPEVLKIANSALRFAPPLPLDVRHEMLDALVWPDEPKSPGGKTPDYCEKAYAWKFDEGEGNWEVTPLWIGITDNTDTEVLNGARPGDRFVKKFKLEQESKFSLQEAFRQADPSNRRL